MTREEAGDKASETIRFGTQDKLQVAYWQDGVLRYAVSGDIDRKELGRIAETVSRSVRQ